MALNPFVCVGTRFFPLLVSHNRFFFPLICEVAWIRFNLPKTAVNIFKKAIF